MPYPTSTQGAEVASSRHCGVARADRSLRHSRGATGPQSPRSPSPATRASSCIAYSRAHTGTGTGTVAVEASDTRWCSDGFEIKCDSGQIVTATFAKDCCDRENMAFRAREGKGLPGEPVRAMLIEAVEQRFGAVEPPPAGHLLQFLSGNGGAYTAHETKRIARSLGLTPVCSPQSNGLAETFINTFKCDYVSRMDLSDTQTGSDARPLSFLLAAVAVIFCTAS